MNITFPAYFCEEAEPAMRWFAYIVREDEWLPVRFNAETKEAAMARAKVEWDKHEQERAVASLRIAEGREKAAKTRARKAMGE